MARFTATIQITVDAANFNDLEAFIAVVENELVDTLETRDGEFNFDDAWEEENEDELGAERVH